LPSKVRYRGRNTYPHFEDERFVAVHVASKGINVFAACSHVGVLKHAKAYFPKVPLYAVVGGLHLSGTNERVVPDTIDAMLEFDLTVIAAGHCTGWRAMTALANTFGDSPD
jgi:7,8-dihydropterin-6-yl-methyl-4-(beta-D-ribofuranosyl)aminobenzene 5'-phosphate synthase